MLCIALIDNISALTYTLATPPPKSLIVPGTPSDASRAMMERTCDAALLPVASLPGLARIVEPLGPYGIACEGAVLSVMVFSRMSLSVLLDERMPIDVGTRSRTARMLLDVLCRLEYGRRPLFVEDQPDASARLLIGDDAVNHGRPEWGWPTIIDLGQWWHGHTDMPFVFAQWVVRRDVPLKQKQQIVRWLKRCVHKAGTPAGYARLVEASLPRMPFREFAQVYYRRVRAGLTMRDMQGMQTFLGYARDHSRCRTIA